MRFFLLFLLIFLTLVEARPKVALVLSGGGARGGAHLGVIKVLEQNNIPIDMIVGTSIGSVVGGLYASGKSSDEIEKILKDTEWTRYITTDYVRSDIPMRQKELDYIYQGHIGLSINKKNEVVLPTGLLKREPLLMFFHTLTQDVSDINHFDKLSIPYVAIATNIQNGQPVVLRSGSLAEAMYASSAIPGGFQPIKINDIDLVDGGLSKNFPIEIAKEMGADVIIAVDVSEPFEKDFEVESYLEVMGQMVNILMRKNADESIDKLRAEDILLTPDLQGYSGLDADKYAEIIQKGEDVANANLANLKRLSLDNQAYAFYKQKHRLKHNRKKIVIDAIEVKNDTFIDNRAITQRLSVKVGDVYDEERLAKDMISLYHLMLFDRVEYDLVQKDGKNILQIVTTPSSNINGEILVSLGFEDDFKGHSAYSLKLGYLMHAINSYNAQWRTHLEIGRRMRAYSEFYQPLDPLERFYIKPSLRYEKTVDVFPAERHSNDVAGNVEIEYSRYGGSGIFGMHLGRCFAAEVGASVYKDATKINLALAGEQKPDYKYDARPIFATLKYDSLDNVNFPTSGVAAYMRWTKEGVISGSDYNYEQLYFDTEFPVSFAANNLTLHLKYGTTYKKNDEDVKRLYGTYTLGGLFNLSGYAPYSFNDDNIALGVLQYRYQLRNAGFLGVLDTPLYVGFSVESGKTWSSQENAKLKDFHYGGSVYVAADTFIGPFYLAYGRADNGTDSFYLYLGEKF